MDPRTPESDSLKIKHYFQVGIAAGLVVAVVSGFMWSRSSPSEEPGEREVVAESANDPELDFQPDEVAPALSGAQTAAAAEKKNAEAVDMNKASEFFAQNLKGLSACMAVNIAESGERLDPSSENLLAALKPHLGDPILRSQDWVTWNLRVGSEERRIRIEADYSESERASRHLLYFKLDVQGQLTLIPLPSEQSKDPNETFIASLLKDGEVYQEEKGERIYFETGQEMLVTEKNGKIDDLEFSNGVKTFRCAGIITSSPSCKCQ